MKRIYLSPPDIGPLDRQLLLDAVDSGWVAPLGPHVDEFEREVAATAAVPYAVALSSGTAALHLSLAALGIGPGDEVLTSTLTFAATANAIAYVGAVPVFIDASAETWTIDPDLLDEELTERAKAGRRPAAVLAVDLYGQCCDYHPIANLCERHGVPLIEDAAEALGASYHERPAGAFGSCAISPSTATRSSPPAAAGCSCRTLARSSSGPATSPRRPATRHRTTSTPRSASTTG
jgi:dTDP-4-amino-4,6-dideoxygalactose transaminase